MENLKVVDIFCGAGGFSEGFRQQGFEIIYGVDKWEPAIRTFNRNFNLNCETKDIIDFEKSIEDINNLPDSDIIIGSPPCVSFSSSNKSGKADKSLGVQLTEIFLKIIVVKKYKNKSTLKAWFMENVPNSVKYLRSSYTFTELNLKEWAIDNKIDPTKTAIVLKNNTFVLNSADYGAIQSRKRAITGEIIGLNKLIIPKGTFQNKHKPLKLLKKYLPTPFEKQNNEFITDFQYNDIRIKKNELSDHFYDTGIFEVEWKYSKFWKTNHPYMGKMSFPENENKPSRTITATKIANSRESIIYRSEFKRVGDGEYRLPTVREAAIIMGFPITYQFEGSENTKWRLVGNSVCCAVSRELAGIVLDSLNLGRPSKLLVNKSINLKNLKNLNSNKLKKFKLPPTKKKDARFRMHIFKDGNLTVTLSNYNIKTGEKSKKWLTSIQYGSGKGFPTQTVDDNFYLELEPTIKNLNGGETFLEIMNNGIIEKTGSNIQLQEMHEQQRSKDGLLEPMQLIEKIKTLIENLNFDNKNNMIGNQNIFKHKAAVPYKQLFALYAINKVSSIANCKVNYGKR